MLRRVPNLRAIPSAKGKMARLPKAEAALLRPIAKESIPWAWRTSESSGTESEMVTLASDAVATRAAS